LKTSSLPLVGFVLTMSAFIYLISILINHNVPLNLATWGMWTVIDILLLATMVKAGNRRPWIMIGFVAGATSIASITLLKFLNGNSIFVWGQAETLAAVAASVALVIWKMTSNEYGVIAMTVAMYIAMIPTWVDGWTKPVGQDPWFWGACAFSCWLTYLGAEKNIAGRFMPACGTLGNGLMFILTIRQFFM
jgi:hypothetical protein